MPVDEAVERRGRGPGRCSRRSGRPVVPSRGEPPARSASKNSRSVGTPAASAAGGLVRGGIDARGPARRARRSCAGGSRRCWRSRRPGLSAPSPRSSISAGRTRERADQAVGERREVEVVVDEQLLRRHRLEDLHQRARRAEGDVEREPRLVAAELLGRSSASGSGIWPSERNGCSSPAPHERHDGDVAGASPVSGSVGRRRSRADPDRRIGAGDPSSAPARSFTRLMRRNRELAEVLGRQAAREERAVDLLRAASNGPLGLERGKPLADLVAVDAVAARVRPGTVLVADRAVRDDVRDDSAISRIRKFSSVRPTLNASRWTTLARRLERGEEGAGDVLDVDDRPPRRPVALHQHLARREREADEVVHDEVAAEPSRSTVRRRAAEEGRREVVVGQLGDVLLGEELGAPVRRDRDSTRRSRRGSRRRRRRRGCRTRRRGSARLPPPSRPAPDATAPR